jgi:hypothetical protein
MAAANQDIENLQRMTARGVATNPAGHGLLLIGGFRYRLLDQSARLSMDLDYHWEGDLATKQAELLRLCRRILVPQARRELGYDGRADLKTGPDADSPSARFVELRFWKLPVAGSQILLPLEITRIARMDPATVRTAGGIAYPTASDLDMIEAKVIAVLNRTFIAHRDFVDIFLYGDRLTSNSPTRLSEKLNDLQIDPVSVRRRLEDLRQNVEYHARSVQGIIDSDLEPVCAAQINAGGGGRTVFERASELIRANMRL